MGLASRGLIIVGMLLCVLSVGSMANAEVYANSAHGDTSSGVNRSTALCEDWPGGVCQIGDCAHCHDTFDASICGNPLMLFAPNNPTSQTDNFCFQCHKGNDGPAQQVANNDYGATFGGGTTMFSSIYDAFNPVGTYASSHDPATMQNYVKNRTWGTWMTDSTNACLACHDQHLSQKNFPVEINANGGVKTAIRRANDVDGYPGDLWGDEPDAVSGRPEMMSDWTTGYQAPLRGDSGYEPGPAGSTIQDGSNLPSFVKMCAGTCHRRKNVPGVLEVNWTTSITSNWPGDPSAHGKAAANNAPGDWGWLKPPYSESSRGSYVLSCTDCHEPHGSTNPTLLRTTVNGLSGLSTGAEGSSAAGGYWYYWCQTCHDLTYDPDTGEGHPVIWPEARCGQYVGCHMSTGSGGSGGNHGYQF